MGSKIEDKFIACLSSDGLQAVVVAQSEVIAHRSGADEHFRPAQLRVAFRVVAELLGRSKHGFG